MDFTTLFGLILLLAIILALGHGDVIAWWKREFRLMRAERWESDQTSDDPAVQRTLARLRKKRQEMERAGMKLLDRDHAPFYNVVTVQQQQRPPAKVIRLPAARRPH